MGAITSYALQTALVLAVEYLVYRWVLAGTTFYRLCRVAIMCCYVLALAALPLMHLAQGLGGHEASEALGIAFEHPTVTVATAQGGHGLWQLVPIAYVGGVAAMLAWTLWSYCRLWTLVRSGRKVHRDGYTLVVIDRDTAPFSWGRYVIANEADADDPMILCHEQAHIRCNHSVDLALAQMFVIFNWFNPAAYLMRSELSAVQEYEADQQVILSGASAKQYQMLLIRKTVGAGFQSIANSLNHSQLKNRLTMMLKSKSKSARRFAAAVLLPSALLAAAMTDIPAVAAVIDNVGAVSYSKDSNNAADAQAPVQNKTDYDVVDNPEVVPVYKDGEMEMYRTLAANMQYPLEAQKAKAQGRAVVKFVVLTDGTIADVAIDKSTGNPSLDAEAVRVIKDHLSTGWSPGRYNGKAVNCAMALPVIYRLQ